MRTIFRRLSFEIKNLISCAYTGHEMAEKHGVTLKGVMNKNELRKLSDLELLEFTSRAAKNEKAATLVLLEHLLEVDVRRAFAADAYSSLFDYVVRGLKYSESQAAERVSAVRLMRETPEVKTHIESGALTLTSAAMIQRHIRAEMSAPGGSKVKVPKETKAALITECLGQSKREVEKILLSHASEPVRLASQELTRQVTATHTELKILIDEETRELLKRAKELSQTSTTAELLKQTLQTIIEKRERQLGKSAPANEAQEHSKPSHSATSTPPEEESKEARNPNARYIPTQFRRAIFTRSNGQCEYRAPHTDARCTSSAHLHVDHVLPLALGGKTELKNLRHLCSAHNQKAAQIAGIAIPAITPTRNPKNAPAKYR